jgi:(p)ppGpp synthase/HD superfamily hydrolase
MYSYRIELAIKACTILHKDQVRKGEIPIPYASHPIAVALILMDYTEDEDVIVTALLHDTLEDTDYTSKEMEEDFGGSVREYVEAITENYHNSDREMSWKQRKQAYAKQLRKAPQQALLVAAADKIHNMRTMIEEYYDDHPRFLSEFEGSLEDRAILYQDIANAINRGLKNDILDEFNHVFDEYKNFLNNVQKSTAS